MFKTDAVNSSLIIHNDPSKSNSNQTLSCFKIQEQKDSDGVDIATFEAATYHGTTKQGTARIVLHKPTTISDLTCTTLNTVACSDIFEYDTSGMTSKVKEATNATNAIVNADSSYSGFTQTSSGVLKVGDQVIAKRVLLATLSYESGSVTSVVVSEALADGDTLELVRRETGEHIFVKLGYYSGRSYVARTGRINWVDSFANTAAVAGSPIIGATHFYGEVSFQTTSPTTLLFTDMFKYHIGSSEYPSGSGSSTVTKAWSIFSYSTFSNITWLFTDIYKVII